MKKSFLSLSIILLLLGAWGCQKDYYGQCCGNGYTTQANETDQGTHYSHQDLAIDFVRRIKMDLGWSVTLVKANTFQYNYIVVYNNDTDTYDAYWIGDYYIGHDIATYIEKNNQYTYSNLTPFNRPKESSGSPIRYRHKPTNYIFEDGQPLSRIPSALQEHFIDAFKRSKAQFIVDKYGLSHERAGELVTLTMNFKALSHKSALTEAEYDAFAMEAVGTSATELLKMAKEGDVAGGLEALKRAADKNGIGVEHAQTLLFEEFGLSLD